MKLRIDKQILKQVAVLLLVSGGLGLASNALNPAGLQLGQAPSIGNPEGAEMPARAGIYLNQTLHSNETLSVALTKHNESSRPPYSVRAASSAAPKPTIGSAIPTRTTWAAVQPLAENGDILLVDSRSQIAFDAGHIPGAVCLPYKSLQARIQAFMAAYPRETPLAIYCANANCAASSKLAVALTNTYGYRGVRYIPGGYLEWRSLKGK